MIAGRTVVQCSCLKVDNMYLCGCALSCWCLCVYNLWCFFLLIVSVRVSLCVYLLVPMLPHGCSDYCSNTNGSYVCSCDAGYALEEDGHTCEGGWGGSDGVWGGVRRRPPPPPTPPNERPVSPGGCDAHLFISVL